MTKVMQEVEIFESTCLDKLENAINVRLSSGLSLYGNMVATLDPDTNLIHYAQMLVDVAVIED